MVAALAEPTHPGRVELLLPTWAYRLREKHRYKSMRGGRGGGKSWSAAGVLLADAIDRPMRVLCARELQNSIRDSVHRLLSDLVERHSLPYEITRDEIRARNGSLFVFEGLRHNVTKIKSYEGVDVCWVEEAQSVSEDSWRVLIPTIRKAGSEIWLTWNPDQATDPTYKRFVTSPPPDCLDLEVGWQDNPWFSDELRREKDHDYRVDPDAAEHVWGGKTRQLSDAQVLRGRWVVDVFEPQPGWDGPYYGADWGFAADPTALVRLWVDAAARTLYVEHEAYGVGVDIDDTPALFAKVPGSSEHVIRADNARPETISYMQRHGYPKLEPCEKWPGSVEDGVEHLRSYAKIVIHERCKHAVEEARLWSYKRDRLTGEIRPELVDAHNHVWDSARYGLGPLIRSRPALWAF